MAGTKLAIKRREPITVTAVRVIRGGTFQQSQRYRELMELADQIALMDRTKLRPWLAAQMLRTICNKVYRRR